MIGSEGIEITSFREILFDSANGYISRTMGALRSPAEARIRRSLAALSYPLRGIDPKIAAEESISVHEDRSARNTAEYVGIRIFSEITAHRGSLLFFVSDELLGAFAAKAAEDYVHWLPEQIALPPSGVAADWEASVYARSRLYAYSKCGEWCASPTSRNALFRCLLLFSAPQGELVRRHSEAVRAALASCDEGGIGGANCAGMAAALKYAELFPQENSGIKENCLC